MRGRAFFLFLARASEQDHKIILGRQGHLESFPPKMVGHLRLFWSSGVFVNFSETKKNPTPTIAHASASPHLVSVTDRLKWANVRQEPPSPVP